MLTLMPLRPKQIKEERSAKNKRDRDPHENIITRCADEAVVMDFDSRVLTLHPGLLVQVI